MSQETHGAVLRDTIPEEHSCDRPPVAPWAKTPRNQHINTVEELHSHAPPDYGPTAVVISQTYFPLPPAGAPGVRMGLPRWCPLLLPTSPPDVAQEWRFGSALAVCIHSYTELGYIKQWSFTIMHRRTYSSGHIHSHIPHSPLLVRLACAWVCLVGAPSFSLPHPLMLRLSGALGRLLRCAYKHIWSLVNQSVEFYNHAQTDLQQWSYSQSYSPLPLFQPPHFLLG